MKTTADDQYDEAAELREQFADVAKECAARGAILDELQAVMKSGSWLGCIAKFNEVRENADYHARQAAELRGQHGGANGRLRQVTKGRVNR